MPDGAAQSGMDTPGKTDFTQGAKEYAVRKKLAPRNMPLTLAVDTRRARTRVGRASTKSARWEGVYRPRIDGSAAAQSVPE